MAQTLHAAGLDGLYTGRTQASVRQERAVDDCDAMAAAADASGLVRTLSGGHREAAVLVEGLTCGACVPLLESWLARQPGITQARVNYASRRAQLTWDPNGTTLVRVLRAIAAAGYAGFPYDAAGREALARRERRALLARTAVALLCAMQVMMFALPLYFATDGVAAEQRLLLDWAAFVLTLPAIFYSALPLFAGARRDLTHGRVGMDVPIALGLVVAFAASVWSMVRGGGPVYFDSVTMFIALVLVARYCDLMARQKAGEAIEAIARQRPDTAERMPAWPGAGDAEVVAAATLAVGDIVLVRPGARVPADGEIVDGRSHVEEAMLTGESTPRARAMARPCGRGSLNCDNALVMRVHASGQDTRLAGILRLSERAAAGRPAVARHADRVARIFVTALLLLAAITALAWTMIDPARALPVTFAVLAVSCPCALALATPAALAAAAGSLAARGVVLARSDALETLAKVSHVVLDKTGTLTQGRLRVTAVATCAGRSEAEVIALAAALEGRSEHPLARAFTAAAQSAAGPAVDDVRQVTGQGIAARIGESEVRIGRADFVAALAGAMPAAFAVVARERTDTLVGLGDANGWLALFALGDVLRPGARVLVDALRALGVTAVLLSGDRRESVGCCRRSARHRRCARRAAARGQEGCRRGAATPGRDRRDGRRRRQRRARARPSPGVGEPGQRGAAGAMDRRHRRAVRPHRPRRRHAARSAPHFFDHPAEPRVGDRVQRHCDSRSCAGTGLAAGRGGGMACSSLVVVGNALRLARPRASGAQGRNEQRMPEIAWKS